MIDCSDGEDEKQWDEVGADYMCSRESESGAESEVKVDREDGPAWI